MGTMKTLKKWNGRMMGPGNRPTSGHYAAYSVNDLRLLFEELDLIPPSKREIRTFWSPCWGNCMKGIELERGVWLTEDHWNPTRIVNDKPLTSRPATGKVVRKKEASMKLVKIKWIVSAKPTGRYRSFENRAWPMAEYPGGDTAGFIISHSGEGYVPARVKEGKHGPLGLYVVCRDTPDGKPVNRKMKAEFDSVENAKLALERFIDKHPEMRPIHYRENKT